MQDLLELMDTNWYGLDENDEADGEFSFQGNNGLQSAFDSPGRGPNSARQHTARTEQPPASGLEYKTPFQLGTSPGGLEDGLGTWANRQKVFSRVAREAQVVGEDLGNTSQRLAYAAALLGSPQLQPEHVQPNPPAQIQREESEDADRNAAWRWRFTRKWQQEQLRQIDGATSIGGGDDDDWATAMDYMAAAAGGADLQFGRTTSTDHTESLEPSLSQSMALLLDASMSKEVGSLQMELGTPGPGDATTPQATRRIAQAVRKAEELMAHQAEIERQVAERWESTEAQQPWAAQSIPAVNIDSWGQFNFILARVMDLATGRQKLLIRGRNRFNVKQAGEALQQEVLSEAANRRLAGPRVDVLGSGNIEWSRERDRCLIITGCAVHSALDTRLKRKEDVGRVAGALARTGLPALHTVIVAEGPQANVLSRTRASNS